MIRSSNHPRFCRRANPLSLLLLVLVGFGLIGCARNKEVIEFDQGYSLNVVKTPLWFPSKKQKVTPAQEEVLFRMGKPDIIRFWWRSDGSLITTSDMTGRKQEEVGEQLQTMDQSWIYLGKGEDDPGQEVIFAKNGASYKVRPLEEPMALVCKYGDPNSRTAPQIIDGVEHETWIWMTYGLQAEISEGKVIEKKYFKSTGQRTWIFN